MDNKGKCTCGKINVLAFGVAIGMAEAVYMLLFGWMGWIWGYGNQMILSISTMFPGYAPTPLGAVIGGGFGFIDGFIFGLIAGLVYNLFNCRKCGCGCCSKDK